jgi:hypothetical protein
MGYQGYLNQQRGERETQSFLNAQEQFYPVLQQSYMNAVRPGLENAYKQGQTATALLDIQRGVRRGSQGLSNQAGLSQAFQSNLGQMQQNAARMVNTQRQSDLQQAHQQRLGMQGNPYQNMGAQGVAQGIDAQRVGSLQMGNVNALADANAQAIANMWSQVYGSQMQTASNAGQSFGQSFGGGGGGKR